MSKLILFEFDCPSCGLTFEALVNPDVYWTQCPKCETNAQRILSAPRIDHQAMAGSDSASPETLRHFDRVHNQRKAIEEKAFRDHGDYGKPAGCD
jgi:putative FmdB family regulatory protein